MTLPKSVKIGPINYAVKEKTDLHSVDGDGRKKWLHGHVVYGDAEIRIAHDQDEQVKVAVIWHEALHVMLYAAGQDDQAENLVRALGYSLVQFVRDNPELVDATVGKASSEIPCAICGGPVIEFSIPNDIWNKVIRPDGHEHDKEYLCEACYFDALRRALDLPVMGEAHESVE